MRRPAVMLMLCVLGCGESKSSDGTNVDTPADTRPADKTPVAQKPAVEQPVTDKPASKNSKADYAIGAENYAAYKKHLRAGRALAKTKDWKGASAEFELALKVIPGDARAASELGWSAFQAGDLDRAREANLLSTRVARDPKVKAASLYNLGRVAEASGDQKRAAAAYRESLELRRNKTVEKRMAVLGVEPPAPPADDCETPMPVEKVCECLTRTPHPEEHREWACEFRDDGSAYAVVTLDGNTYTETYFLAKQPAGWFVFEQGEPTFSGSSGINEGFFASIEVRAIAGREVLWISKTLSRTDADAGINEFEESEEESVTLCVVPAKPGAAFECPLTIPVSSSSSRSLIDEELGYDPEGALQGAPTERETRLSVTLTDKGTVVVKADKGEIDEDTRKLIGEHKLF